MLFNLNIIFIGPWVYNIHDCIDIGDKCRIRNVSVTDLMVGVNNIFVVTNLKSSASDGTNVTVANIKSLDNIYN